MDDRDRTDERTPVQDGSGPLDLMSASSQGGISSRNRRARGWIAVAVVAGLAALGGGLYGAFSYDSARSWKETAKEWQEYAEDLEAEFDDLEAERDELADQLAATEDELAATEEELRDTEDRLAEVTAEREAARDAVAFRADEADLTAAIRAALSTCVNDLFAWLDDSPPSDAGDATWDAYFQAGQQIAATCADARGNFETFAQALEPPSQ